MIESEPGKPIEPESATFRFHQPDDDMTPEHGVGQDLTVEVTDGGGGPYVVLATQRWAMDAAEFDRFVATLRWCLAQCKGVQVDS